MNAIPLALGDSFRGFRIVGTNYDYLDHYGASLAQGALWQAPMEAVLGAGKHLLMMNAIAQPDARDPTQLPADDIDYVANIVRAVGSPRVLRAMGRMSTPSWKRCWSSRTMPKRPDSGLPETVGCAKSS